MIVGYRVWEHGFNDFNDPMLWSLTAEFGWEEPVVYSGDEPVDEYDDSDLTLSSYNPSMGIFSQKSYELLLEEDWLVESVPSCVSGIIRPYGVVQEHEYGYRSEYAQVMMLYTVVKCSFSECDRDSAVIGMAALCNEHVGYLEVMRSWSPDIVMDADAYFAGLIKRYHCDYTDSMNAFLAEGKRLESAGDWDLL